MHGEDTEQVRAAPVMVIRRCVAVVDRHQLYDSSDDEIRTDEVPDHDCNDPHLGGGYVSEGRWSGRCLGLPLRLPQNAGNGPQIGYSRSEAEEATGWAVTWTQLGGCHLAANDR